MSTFLQLTPNLMVRNITESVTFYTDILEMEIIYLIRSGNTTAENFDTSLQEDVKYQYVGLSKGDFRLALQEQSNMFEDIQELDPGSKPGFFAGTFYIEVPSLESFKKRLGGLEFREKDTTWYGMQELYLKDPNGYILCIGSKDANFSS